MTTDANDGRSDFDAIPIHDLSDEPLSARETARIISRLVRVDLAFAPLDVFLVAVASFLIFGPRKILQFGQSFIDMAHRLTEELQSREEAGDLAAPSTRRQLLPTRESSVDTHSTTVDSPPTPRDRPSRPVPTQNPTHDVQPAPGAHKPSLSTDVSRPSSPRRTRSAATPPRHGEVE